MREYSEEAWKIASLYSHTLASETRDLAAHIDVAIALEREACAQVAMDAFERLEAAAVGFSQGDNPSRWQAQAEAAKWLAGLIRNRKAKASAPPSSEEPQRGDTGLPLVKVSA